MSATAKPVPAALQRPPAVPLDQKATWNIHPDATSATGLSARTIQKAIAAGELPACRVGRRVLLRPDDVETWLASKVTTAGPADLAKQDDAPTAEAE
jgi:excisionase family DNA binding protein